MRAVWVVAFITIHSVCLAQSTFTISDVPIFKTSADSARYAQLNQTLRQAFADRSNTKNIDSLMQQIRWLSENRVIGQQKTYQGSPGFISADSLQKMSDYSAVRQVTVSKSKRLPKAIWQCQNLQTLELVNSKVKTLGKLKKLPNLQVVNVLNNTPHGKLRISKSKTVKQLTIRGDNPTNLPAGYKNLARLEKLDLSSCALTRFPTGLTKNTYLKEIVLNSNSIQLSNSRIEFLPSVEKLALQRNKLDAIPEQIKNLPNLKQLTLNHNSISVVDPALGELQHIEQISFYRNKLTQLPEGIFRMSNLKEIDLYYNNVERVDERLGNLKNLEVLYLSNNKLIQIPESIGNLTHLRELYLSNNRLVEMPTTFGALQQLKVLRINSNRLSQFSFDITSLVGLENLDISSNQFTELPAGITSLHNLKLLILAENPWDNTTRASLPEIINTLKSRQVLVHVSE